MAVGVVSTSYREADLLNTWIAHLLSEDVALILVADKLADDQSRTILDQWRQGTNGMVQWFDDTEDSHRQAWWTDLLAEKAHEQGVDWILPVDIDEFPYSLTGESIGKTLLSLSDCYKLFMQVWPHKDWQNRYVEPHRLNKVCYKYSPDAHVAMGSHEVTLPGGERDILAMREWQYRSVDHFIAKTHSRNQTLEPAARLRGDGFHHLRLEGFSDDQMRQEWETMISQPTVLDPIPTRMARSLIPN